MAKPKKYEHIPSPSHKQKIAVECPSCAAPKGEFCKTKNGHPALDPHAKRAQLYRRLYGEVK